MQTSILIAVFSSIFLLKFLVDKPVYATYIFPFIAIIILVVIFSVGTWGIKQSFVDFNYDEHIQRDPITSGSSDYVSNAVSSDHEEEGQLVLENIRTFIRKNKPYRDPELTLEVLAKASKIQARQISSTINQFANVNFNTFINQFRVEEAKSMLVDEKYRHLNILGIGYEVGFNSKATFYSVFKKLTGMTPAKWQKHAGSNS